MRHWKAVHRYRMIKMPGRITSCCVSLLLALTSVSAVRPQLNSINDLISTNLPEHCLVLLHWFAKTVRIGTGGVIHLNFNPGNGDFGSHHYGNYESLLNQLPWGYKYYAVGNINQDTSRPLPHCVIHPTDYTKRNRARIIIRVREQTMGWQASQITDQVYITQHYSSTENQGTEYDPEHTYQVTINLLCEIRGYDISTLMTLRNNFGSSTYNSQLWNSRNTWGYEQSRHQGATRRNEQHDFWSDAQDSVSSCCRFLLYLVVVLVLFFVFLLIAANNK